MGALDMLGGSAAGGPIGAIGGALISGIGGLIGGQQQNAANSQALQQQFFDNLYLQNQAEKFNKEMSSTAYQRMVADMEKAGLNPILGVASGGASYAGAPAASVGLSPRVSPIGQAIASAQQGAKLIPEVQQAQAQTELLGKQATTQDKIQENTEADTGVKNKMVDTLGSQITNNLASAGAASAAAVKSTADANLSNAQANEVNKRVGAGGMTVEGSVGVPGWGGVKVTAPGYGAEQAYQYVTKHTSPAANYPQNFSVTPPSSATQHWGDWPYD